MSKELEALKIGIPKLKKLYENNAKKMSKNDILGFDLTFGYLDKALQRLEAIENSNPSEALENFRCLVNVSYDTDNIDEEQYEEYSKDYDTIKQALLKTQEQEKENELLKEIIKSFFDKGCPLHQYIDKNFGLTIEVDNECSIMHLGEFKGVDLNKKLKEVLE